jgi:hypothetical protein
VSLDNPADSPAENDEVDGCRREERRRYQKKEQRGVALCQDQKHGEAPYAQLNTNKAEKGYRKVQGGEPARYLLEAKRDTQERVGRTKAEHNRVNLPGVVRKEKVRGQDPHTADALKEPGHEGKSPQYCSGLAYPLWNAFNAHEKISGSHIA